MASVIDVVEEVESRDQESASTSTGGGEAAIGGEGLDSLRNDVCTAAGLGDLEKLRRLVECEGCSVSEPDGQGYYALQWAALSVRPAEAQYIIEVCGDSGSAGGFRFSRNVPRWFTIEQDVEVRGKWIEAPNCFCFNLWYAWEGPEFNEVVVIGSSCSGRLMAKGGGGVQLWVLLVSGFN